MSLPATLAPPRHLLTSASRWVAIDVDGGFSLLHPDRLSTVEGPIRPFAGEVTKAVLLDSDHLVATWVERDVAIARMALLDLRQPLEEGIDLPGLRDAALRGRMDHHQVAGAVLSHILDAEPLALCAHDGDLIFATHRRGLYRIDAAAHECWRRAPLTWSALEHLQDGDVVVSILSSNDGIWCFSLAGGYARLNPDTGDVEAEGTLDLGAKVERVWTAEGEFLFGLSQGRIARWDGEQLDIEQARGSIQDAHYRSGGWTIAGWREHLRWAANPPRSIPSRELGVRIVDHPEHGLRVLENSGHWVEATIADH